MKRSRSRCVNRSNLPPECYCGGRVHVCFENCNYNVLSSGRFQSGLYAGNMSHRILPLPGLLKACTHYYRCWVKQPSLCPRRGVSVLRVIQSIPLGVLALNDNNEMALDGRGYQADASVHYAPISRTVANVVKLFLLCRSGLLTALCWINVGIINRRRR